MPGTDKLSESLERVEEKTEDLIYEFHAHYQSYVEEHPDDTNRKDEIFQAWVIQKIAGLQLSIIALAEKYNHHIKNH
ncbi:hypothetical protein D1AOALGA4SA_177 [Olavius algarvensis Delta 1 endosymbiont]|nr:hypothetical protein D1AOALGA4SA_177 [Olavius algarvensis Delta 1 endosymbiont]